MLTNILVAANIGIAIANGFILMRCWRTMRKVDKLHAETWETLGEVIILRDRLEKLNPEDAEPTNE